MALAKAYAFLVRRLVEEPSEGRSQALAFAMKIKAGDPLRYSNSETHPFAIRL